MNADVLWISDFKIPLSVPELTDQMLEYRKVDTHFYGLQLGIAENEWMPFFDRIYIRGEKRCVSKFGRSENI